MAGWSWFPDKKGVVNGVVLTGFGAGGFVFNLIGKVFVYGGNRVVDRGAGGGDGGRRQGVFWRETTGRFSVMLSRIDPSRLSTRSVPSLLVGTKLINPNGASSPFPPEVAEAWPTMLRTLAGIYAAMSILGSLMIKTNDRPVTTKVSSSAQAEGKFTCTHAACTGANMHASEILF